MRAQTMLIIVVAGMLIASATGAFAGDDERQIAYKLDAIRQELAQLNTTLSCLVIAINNGSAKKGEPKKTTVNQ